MKAKTVLQEHVAGGRSDRVTLKMKVKNEE